MTGQLKKQMAGRNINEKMLKLRLDPKSMVIHYTFQKENSKEKLILRWHHWV